MPIAAARIAEGINLELRRQFHAAEAQYGASAIAMPRHVLRTAPRSSQPLDAHIVRGEEAQQLNKRRAEEAAASAAAAKAAPAPLRSISLSKLPGFGAGKQRAYAAKGVTSIEGLAALKPTAEFAMTVTSRHGTTSKVREEALSTVRGHVKLAQDYLKARGRWPPAAAAMPASTPNAPAPPAVAPPARAPNVAPPAAAPNFAPPAAAAPLVAFGAYDDKNGYHGVRCVHMWVGG